MRCNQVTISIERFGEYVPKDYPADVQRISVYCDDFKSIYAAVSKAYAMAVNELGEYETIGVRADVSTNEFAEENGRKMNGEIPLYKRKYEEDRAFEYCEKSLSLYRDYVWVYEHSNEILEALKECGDSESFASILKDRFGLSNLQVRKLSQIRLDMLTKERYEETKAEIEKLEKQYEEMSALHRQRAEKIGLDADTLELYRDM